MDNIKEAIKKAGYTQKDFAENVLGVKRLALYRKLKGEVKFTKLEKEKIKEVLNIDIDSLVNLTSPFIFLYKANLFTPNTFSAKSF